MCNKCLGPENQGLWRIVGSQYHNRCYDVSVTGHQIAFENKEKSNEEGPEHTVVSRPASNNTTSSTTVNYLL